MMFGAVHTGSATTMPWTAGQMQSCSALWDALKPNGWLGCQLSAISQVRKPNSIQVNRDCKV